MKPTISLKEKACKLAKLSTSPFSLRGEAPTYVGMICTRTTAEIDGLCSFYLFCLVSLWSSIKKPDFLFHLYSRQVPR